MLFKKSQLDGIADGTVDLAFRRWPAPRVRPGSQQRTAIGVIGFDVVEIVEDLSDEEARRAGFASRDAVFKAFRDRAGDLYRIELHLEGPDPRAVLRERPAAGDELRSCAAASTGWGRGRCTTCTRSPSGPGSALPTSPPASGSRRTRSSSASGG